MLHWVPAVSGDVEDAPGRGVDRLLAQTQLSAAAGPVMGTEAAELVGGPEVPAPEPQEADVPAEALT